MAVRSTRRVDRLEDVIATEGAATRRALTTIVELLLEEWIQDHETRIQALERRGATG